MPKFTTVRSTCNIRQRAESFPTLITRAISANDYETHLAAKQTSKSHKTQHKTTDTRNHQKQKTPKSQTTTTTTTSEEKCKEHSHKILMNLTTELTGKAIERNLNQHPRNPSQLPVQIQINCSLIAK